MFGAWWKLGIDATLLAMESQQVIGLRLARLSGGGALAQAEAHRMVAEKITAAGEAAMLMATGASSQRVVAGYRRKVRANARRLAKIGSGEPETV
ncbi:MAG TPA: hypothetical protein VF641_04340 [Methylobacterium sp.]